MFKSLLFVTLYDTLFPLIVVLMHFDVTHLTPDQTKRTLRDFLWAVDAFGVGYQYRKLFKIIVVVF